MFYDHERDGLFHLTHYFMSNSYTILNSYKLRYLGESVYLKVDLVDPAFIWIRRSFGARFIRKNTVNCVKDQLHELKAKIS